MGWKGRLALVWNRRSVFHAGIAHHKSQLALLQQPNPQVVEFGTDPRGTGVGTASPASEALVVQIANWGDEAKTLSCSSHIWGVLGRVRGWNLWVQKVKKGSRDGPEKRLLLIIAGRCWGWKTDLEAACKEIIREKMTCPLIWKGMQGRGWTWEL